MCAIGAVALIAVCSALSLTAAAPQPADAAASSCAGKLIESRNLKVGGKTKTSARGRCIAASGYLWMNGKRHVISTQPWVGHCG